MYKSQNNLLLNAIDKTLLSISHLNMASTVISGERLRSASLINLDNSFMAFILGLNCGNCNIFNMVVRCSSTILEVLSGHKTSQIFLKVRKRSYTLSTSFMFYKDKIVKILNLKPTVFKKYSTFKTKQMEN